MRNTGPSAQVREEVFRAQRGRCRRCGRPIPPGSVRSLHHRQPRGMGGTRDPHVNHPAHLAFVCGSGTTGCHGYIESHRAEAYEMGWLVRRPTDPCDVPWLGDGAPLRLRPSGQDREL